MVALLVVVVAVKLEVMKAYREVALWVVYLVFWLDASRVLALVVTWDDLLVVKMAVWMAELLGYQLVWLSAVKKAGVRAFAMAGPTAGQRVGSKAAPRADLSAGVMAVSSVVAMGEMKVESTVVA